jgi:hypothetical protein
MALSADTERNHLADTELRDYAVKASTTVYKGAAVGLDTTGYARGYTVGDTFVGIAYEQADNSSGSAGDINVKCYVEGTFELTVSGATVDDIGAPVYASDDNTFLLSPANAGCIGYIDSFESSGKANVRIQPTVSLNSSQFVTRSCTLDCETGQTPQTVTLIPASLNKNGMYIVHCFGIVKEVFAGTSQDQGIVTLKDTSGTTTGITLTVSDAGADAVNDVVAAAGTGDITGATTGTAQALVAANKGLNAVVTQVTAGGTPAGKLLVCVQALLA